MQINHNQGVAIELIIIFLNEMTFKSFVFTTDHAEYKHIPIDIYYPIFKTIYKVISRLATIDSNQIDSIKTVIRKITKSFTIENCEQLVAVIEKIYSNILCDINMPSCQQAAELCMWLWICVVEECVNWMDDHMIEVIEWNKRKYNALVRTSYNYLAWPLGKSMKIIGVSEGELYTSIYIIIIVI